MVSWKDPPTFPYNIAACAPKASATTTTRSPSAQPLNRLPQAARNSRLRRRSAMSSSSSSASSVGGSHAGLALAATAMALSGTLVLFSLCRAKPHQDLVSSDDGAAAAGPSPSAARLRPCLSSSEKRKREKARRGSKKRVRFADDVVDNGAAWPAPEDVAAAAPSCGSHASAAAAPLRVMPANREALYRGMLRGRSMLRVACSY